MAAKRSAPGQGRQRGLAAVPPPPNPQVFRGRRRDTVLCDLAMDAMSPQEIADRERVSLRDIEALADKYRNEILAIREAMVTKATIDTAGLWICDKRARLAEYQAEVEDIDETLQELRDNNLGWSRAHRDMLRVKLDLFRQAADELGAYPQRQAAPARQGSTVHYVIESEDSEALT